MWMTACLKTEVASMQGRALCKLLSLQLIYLLLAVEFFGDYGTVTKFRRIWPPLVVGDKQKLLSLSFSFIH